MESDLIATLYALSDEYALAAQRSKELGEIRKYKFFQGHHLAYRHVLAMIQELQSPSLEVQLSPSRTEIDHIVNEIKKTIKN